MGLSSHQLENRLKAAVIVAFVLFVLFATCLTWTVCLHGIITDQHNHIQQPNK